MSSKYRKITDSTPLLWREASRSSQSQDRLTLPYYREEERHEALNHKDISGNDPHAQFCALSGCPPSNPKSKEKFSVSKKSLYGRAVSQLSSQRRAYAFSATLSNTLLLSQVILGAALTGLGASASSHILITIFGAMNTIIAGVVAYLKSRGQPMRARMYRDDLERVMDEIENSEIMWLGISQGIHGYSDIDTDEVTVRSEIARLTRLYERAVRLNGMNNPDMYMAGSGGFDGNTSGGVRPNRGVLGLSGGAQNATAPAATVPPETQSSGNDAAPSGAQDVAPEDAAPATKVDSKDDKKKDGAAGATPVQKIEESKSDGKKPAMDGASDTANKSAESSAKPSTDSQTSASPSAPSSASSPAPQATAPAKPPAPAAAPAPAPAPAPAALSAPVDDPDASPATAARLKPKRSRSDKQDEGSRDAKKVAGDEDD